MGQSCQPQLLSKDESLLHEEQCDRVLSTHSFAFGKCRKWRQCLPLQCEGRDDRDVVKAVGEDGIDKSSQGEQHGDYGDVTHGKLDVTFPRPCAETGSELITVIQGK